MRRQANSWRGNTLPLRFLALALLAHVPLLLLTVERKTGASATAPLEVELIRTIPEAQVLAVPASAAKPQPAVTAAPRAASRPLPDEPVSPLPQAAPMPSARRIIQSIEQLGPRPAKSPEALPGRPTHSAAYQAMSRPLLALPANALDGTVAPAKAEIVDRWLEPGGVHQVVVRSPNGKTYCGRQEASDPLRPWTQMPMLFHECAGGGPR